MSKPVFLVLVSEPNSRQSVLQELGRRYGTDYEIIGEGSASAALRRLEELRDEAREVVIIFSDQHTQEMEGTTFLMHAQEMHRDAKRALLVDLGDISCAGTLLEALTFGQADNYITKPFEAPDEQFHRGVTELLDEWAQSHRGKFEFVRIVGESASPRSFELRDLVHRAGIGGSFYDASSPEGRELLKAVEVPSKSLPVCVLYNAEVLINPTNVDLAEAIGVSTHPEKELYDLAIVGAGPAGLSAAVYAASEGLKTVVVERDAPGGQAGTSSLVRNYLGFARGISGGDLMQQAYRQAWLFQAQFVFARDAVELSAEGEQRVITLSNGEQLHSRSVLLAPGIAYRKLGLPSIDGLLGAGAYYGTAVSEAQAMRGKQVFIVGAGNSAGQAAVHLAKYAQQVTLLVRGESVAPSMSDYLIREIKASRNITVRMHTEVLEGRGEHLLEGLVLRNRHTGAVEEVRGDAVFILIGGEPYTGWLPPAVLRDSQGYILTGDDLNGRHDTAGWWSPRGPLPLETSMPGVFAVGDARHGAAKRIANAVGEGSVAVSYVHEYLAELERAMAAVAA